MDDILITPVPHFFLTTYTQLKEKYYKNLHPHQEKNLFVPPPFRVQYCDNATNEMIAGKLLNQFPIDPVQGSAGISVNMNVNEVLTNRALEIIDQPRGRYDIISPNNVSNIYFHLVTAYFVFHW